MNVRDRDERKILDKIVYSKRPGSWSITSMQMEPYLFQFDFPLSLVSIYNIYWTWSGYLIYLLQVNFVLRAQIGYRISKLEWDGHGDVVKKLVQGSNFKREPKTIWFICFGQGVVSLNSMVKKHRSFNVMREEQNRTANEHPCRHATRT